jgi:hypothetical protein
MSSRVTPSTSPMIRSKYPRYVCERSSKDLIRRIRG